MTGFNDSSYLRRLTPEQQQAYGRYLLARRGAAFDDPGDQQGRYLAVGADSGTPVADSPARSDRRSLESIFGAPDYSPYAPDTAIPDGALSRPPANNAAKLIEARKAGYSDSEINDHLAKRDPIQVARDELDKNDESPSPSRLPALPPPNPVAQALDAAGNALSTARGWIETRGNRAFGNAAGIPRMVMDNAAVEWLMPSVIPYVRKYLPTGDDATNHIRRHGGIIPTGVLREERLKARAEGREPPLPPETNLPGVVGKVVDSAVEGVVLPGLAHAPRLIAPFGAVSVWPLVSGATRDGGLAIGDEVNKRRQARDAEPRPPVSPYGFEDLFRR